MSIPAMNRTRITDALRRLGVRTIAAMMTAFLAALLLFLSPEIGIGGAVGGLVVGVVSAILVHPHSRV